MFRSRSGERTDHILITGTPGAATVTVEGGETRSLTATLDGEALTVTMDGLRARYRVADSDHQVWLAGDDGVTLVEEVREAPVRPDDEHSGDAELVSPMPGLVVAIGVQDGATLAVGTVVVTVEAMKMEHALSAPVDGVVELLVAPSADTGFIIGSDVRRGDGAKRSFDRPAAGKGLPDVRRGVAGEAVGQRGEITPFLDPIVGLSIRICGVTWSGAADP